MSESRIQRVVVYCASSSAIPAQMLAEGRRLGALLAREGVEVVCGGGSSGLMGAIIDGVVAEGGSAIGVIPQFMVERGWDHPHLPRRIVTETMAERKAEMLRLADAVIALPGGIGTWEELLEAMTLRQLGQWHGRIIVANWQGYYAPLIEQFNRAVAMQFMHPGHVELFEVAESADEAASRALIPDTHGPFTQKIRDSHRH